MGTFGKDALALIETAVDEVFAVDELELFEEREGFEPGLLVFVNGHAVDFEGGDVELEGMSRLQVLALEELIFLAEVYGGNIAHAETTTCNLVGIGRTNAFEGGAYLGVSFGLLVSCIEETVGRNDEVGFLGDIKVFGGIDTALAQGFNLSSWKMPEGIM